jgi:hypothetical protein
MRGIEGKTTGALDRKRRKPFFGCKVTVGAGFAEIHLKSPPNDPEGLLDVY